MFTSALRIVIILCFYWGTSFPDDSWKNHSAINVIVLDHVFCQQEQIKATFCIRCGSDFPDFVAVSIVQGENDANGDYQMLCVPPRWMCSGPITGTYNTTSDALEINFIFNLTVHAGHYLRIVHKRNGSQEYQQILLKQYKHSIINNIVIDVVFCQQEQTKATFCIFCGSEFHDAITEVQDEDDVYMAYQMFTYNTTSDALEINLISNFTVLEGYYFRIIHERNGSQEYQQILLKPYSLTKAANLEPYCALSCPRNATEQIFTLPAGSCLHHVRRGLTMNTKCSHGYYGKNCENICSDNCYVARRCDSVKGQCTRGCKPGWTTETCTQKCPTGTFGPDCRRECGHCSRRDQCHFINGRCLEGCSSGYHGERCQYQCSTGYFGKNCLQKCSAFCREKSSCNRTTGECNEGCQQGRIGLLCERADGDMYKYSSNGITPILASFVLQVAVFGSAICVF